MKKFFTLMLALAAVVVANAKVVTIDPANLTVMEKAGAVSETVDGVQMNVTNGIIAAATESFPAQVRIYKNATITLSAEEDITAIVFTCTANEDAKYGPGCFAAQEGYTYSGKIGTWKGTAAKSVAFKSEKDQVRASKIEVYIGEAPAEVKYDTLTVAKAIEVAGKLDDNKESETMYYVEGFVCNAAKFSEKYGNQIFFMVDDATKSDSLFQAYGAIAKKDGEIYPVANGDQVRVLGTLKKYIDAKNNNRVQLEILNPTVEYISEVPDADRSIEPIKVDTITVAAAIKIAEALAEPESGKSNYASGDYVVMGYAVKVYDKNEDNTWSFYMADDQGAKGDFMASNAKADADVIENDFMYVKGSICKYKATKSGNIILQIYKGEATHGVAPKVDTIDVNVAGAMAAAEALGEEGITKACYRVVGYVASIPASGAYDAEYGNMTFYMSDDATATKGDFQAYRVRIDAPGATVGDWVAVIGKIKKDTYGVEIENGTAYIIGKQGIENVVMTEKAQKVVIDGVLYIMRDNKLYDVRGTQVR